MKCEVFCVCAAISVGVSFIMGSLLTTVLGILVILIIKCLTTTRSEKTASVTNTITSAEDELYEEIDSTTTIQLSENACYGRVENTTSI